MNKKLWATLSFLKSNLVWVIPFTMLLGLIFGSHVKSDFLKSLIFPLTFLMIYPMMINLQIKKSLSGHDYKLQLYTLFINFGIVPFVAFGIGKLFFSQNIYAALGLLLLSTLPTSGMTISWTGFAKGNLDAAIKMAVFSLVIGSLLTPLFAGWLIGTEIDIPIAKIFQQVATVVFLPMLLGYITQRIIIQKYGEKRYRQNFKPRFPLISTLGLLGIVFSAMALKANTILSNLSGLLLMFIPLILLYGFTFLLATISGKLFFNREDSIALIYGTAPKNVSIALAIALNAFGKQGAEIALIIALAYIIQLQTSAWCNKFIDRCFGVYQTQPEEQILVSGNKSA